MTAFHAIKYTYRHAKAYSEPSQTYEMERFAKIVSSYQTLIIIAIRSILDVWQGSECASDIIQSKICHKADRQSICFWIKI